MGCSKFTFNWEVYRDNIHWEKRKISNKQPKLTYQDTKKRRTKLRVSRRNKIIKIKAEIMNWKILKIIKRLINQGLVLWKDI